MEGQRLRRGTVVRVVLAAAAAAGALAVGACGSSERDTNLVNGKELFVERCGACHILERAGTQGIQGPNLDAAFQQAIADGFNRDTVRGVTKEQILYPGNTSAMPAELVTGQDAEDVAAYVAEAAASPGEDTGDLATAGVPTEGGPEAQAFATTCGSCHTLEAAGTQGQIGPSLDGAALDPQRVLAAIQQGPGEMPPNLLSGAEAQQVADYVAENSGG